MSKRGLGKGFDALVPIGINVQQVSAAPEERIHKLAIDIVRPKSDQPRKYFDELALQQLADSISTHGIMQPIVVVETEQNMYTIIAGERRWRAAKKVGLTEVPVVVRTASEHQQLELALLENIQREDLSPLETAATIVRLNEQFGQSHADIAVRLSKAPATISNIVRLLALPETMQQALADKQISEGHARALLSLTKQPKEQQVLFEQILKYGWNVRQAESFAAAAKNAAATAPVAAPKKATQIAAQKEQEKAAAQYLKAPVVIQNKVKGGGRIVIGFTDEKDLARILGQIQKQQKR